MRQIGTGAELQGSFTLRGSSGGRSARNLRHSGSLQSHAVEQPRDGTTTQQMRRPAQLNRA
jgi:hypothetical protein